MTIFGAVEFRFVTGSESEIFGLQPKPVSASGNVVVPDVFRNPRPRCTAFFIAPDLFITASHCSGYLQTARLGERSLSADWQAAVSVDEFSQLTFLGQISSSTVEELSPAAVVWNDSALDVMIVRWVHKPAAAFFNLCDNLDDLVRQQSRVRLVGHPNGLPLAESFGQMRLAAGAQSNLWFQHDADSLPGQSGAPVLATSSRGEVCVAGVHVRGAGQNLFVSGNSVTLQKSAEEFATEACLNQPENLRTDCEKSYQWNKAVRADVIQKTLREAVPQLADLSK